MISTFDTIKISVTVTVTQIISSLYNAILGLNNVLELCCRINDESFHTLLRATFLNMIKLERHFSLVFIEECDLAALMKMILHL